MLCILLVFSFFFYCLLFVQETLFPFPGGIISVTRRPGDDEHVTMYSPTHRTRRGYHSFPRRFFPLAKNQENKTITIFFLSLLFLKRIE